MTAEEATSHPSADDLHALSIEEFGSLIAALLRAEGRNPQKSGEQGLFDFRLSDPDGVAIVIHPTAGASPLTGVALTAIRRSANEAGVGRVDVFTSGTYSVKARAELSRALEMLQPVTVSVSEAADVLAMVGAQDEVQQEYFPTPDQTETAAKERSVPTSVVRSADRILPKSPPSSSPDYRRRIFHLLQTVLLVGLLIAIPIPIGPERAQTVAVVALIVLIMTAAGSLALGRWFSRPTDTWRYAPLRSLLWVPDGTSVRRGFTRDPKWTTRRFVVFLMIALPVRAVGLIVRTAPMLFFLFFGAVFMLIWSHCPDPCSSDADACAGAFRGLAGNVHVGDFLYMSVQGAFFNQPSDGSPASDLAQAAVTSEFIISATVIASFAAAFGFKSDG